MSAKHPTDNAGFQNHQHHYDRHRHYLNEYISTKQRNNKGKKKKCICSTAIRDYHTGLGLHSAIARAMM
uniref:Uncharacterized protein n=1 Tax=Glossina palpalis gambiensis TaxID=67801 RepID=A0A1B0B0D2_9MUSC